MCACASAFSHQRCLHACTVFAAGRNRILELSELCVASRPSRALLSSDRLSSSQELGQLSFVDFKETKRKKLLQTSLRRAQERPWQMSELRSCRSQPVEELRTPFKHQHKACCPCESAKPFPGSSSARESLRDRANALHFSCDHALTLPNFTRVGSGPATSAYMVQQVTCTRGAVWPAYIALCPNVKHRDRLHFRFGRKVRQ